MILRKIDDWLVKEKPMSNRELLWHTIIISIVVSITSLIINK